jgi:hypothetical protein
MLTKNKQHKPQAKRGKNKEEKTRVVLNSESESSVQTESSVRYEFSSN